MNRVFPIALILLVSACGQERLDVGTASSISSSSTVESKPASVLTGAGVFFRDRVESLRGKRVGAIVNHTALVDGTHVVDSLSGSGVAVTMIFSPEHGFRGRDDAGAKIQDSVDEETGIQIFSLYGTNRAPTKESLESVDVLVFDIQDVGARFYTYISTLGLSMQAAAENGIPFWVLDRPNPLGGNYVDGFVLEPEQQSYVGMYPIPIAHGMTVGELARMIVAEAFLPGLENLDLTVVEVEGWKRDMKWPVTGLDWIAPSPNLPTVETALLYPGTCLIEATTASEGRGTKTPFKLIGAPWLDGDKLERDLTDLQLAGVTFEATAFTPVSIPGMSTNPKHRDVELKGIRIDVTDSDAVDALAVGIELLVAMQAQAVVAGESNFLRESGMRRLAGTNSLYSMLKAGQSADTIRQSWVEDVESFRNRRADYLLYD